MGGGLRPLSFSSRFQMSRRIQIGSGPEVVVSDSEYDNIDWGSSGDDFVSFSTEDGGFVLFSWANTLSVVGYGADPGPGSFLGYTIKVRGEVDNHISEATKDALKAEMTGPGSKDKIVSFVTTGGEEYHVALNSISELVIAPDTLVIEP